MQYAKQPKSFHSVNLIISHQCFGQPEWNHFLNYWSGSTKVHISAHSDFFRWKNHSKYVVARHTPTTYRVHVFCKWHTQNSVTKYMYIKHFQLLDIPNTFLFNYIYAYNNLTQIIGILTWIIDHLDDNTYQIHSNGDSSINCFNIVLVSIWRKDE